MSTGWADAESGKGPLPFGIVSRSGEVASVRVAAGVCNVTPPVVRRWLSLGLIPQPPWTLQQLRKVRDMTDPTGRRRGPQVPHGTATRWTEGCSCRQCCQAQSDTAKARFRRRAQARLPAETRRQLLDAIYSGKPFKAVLTDLNLTSNQVWGLTRTDQDWSDKLEAALAATRRDDVEHGTNTAYLHGCVCKECPEHQRQRLAKKR